MEEEPRPVDSAGVEPTLIRAEASSPSGPTLIPGAPSTAPSPGPAGRAFGRYTLLEELGHGGMGIVWKAWDTELSRVVALKQIRAEGAGHGELVTRFVREARLAAKLRHPHVVAVHDVGVHEGQHYFTTDYIAGRTLDRILAEGPIPLRQAVAWVKSIAEALSYAHEQGVVHRDVKPANLLIGEDGRPYVMDFGLAREVETETGLTMSGDLLGTPAYMSPEQASGRTRDAGPASDQFSLGGTLYEMLTGEAPFAAADLRGLLNAVVEQDPVPPTRINARVHRDLEVICLKALEKDPSRRYGPMRDLAADLGRWLEGEPIQARPAGRWERRWRIAKRHRWVAIPSAVAVLLLFGGIAWVALRAWGKEREVRAAFSEAARLEADGDAATDPSRREALWKEAQGKLQWVEGRDEGNDQARSAAARIAHRLDQLRLQQDLEARLATLDKAGKVDDVIVRFADLSETVLWPMERVFYDDRLAIEEKQEKSASLWREVERFMAETPSDDASQATMWACAGWARFRAAHVDEGLAWMRRAEEIDPEVPYGPLLYAMACFSCYADTQPLPEVVFGGARGLSLGTAGAETHEMGHWRAQMEQALATAEGRLVWGRQEVRQYRAAIEAIRAMQRGEYEIAATEIARALERRELRPIRFGLLVARGRARFLTMAFDDALADLEEARTTREGSTKLWTDMAEARIARSKVSALKGEDPRELLRRAIDDLGEALGRCPDHRGAFVVRGMAHRSLGDAERERGGDPRASYASAIADYGEAVRVDPESADAYAGRARAHRCLGEAGEARGEDPSKSFERSIADLDAAVRLEPGAAQNLLSRGVVHLRRGQAAGRRGHDPSGSLREAIADFGEALRRDPASPEAYCNRGIAHQQMGRWGWNHGRDPSDDFQRAIADFDEALRLSPEFAGAYNNRGTAHLCAGDLDVRQGRDSAASYERAAADFTEALKRNPESTDAYSNRGVARMNLGSAEQARGADPSQTYDEALADFTEALKRNPAALDPRFNRAILRIHRGEAQRARGQDPSESLEQAIADCGEVLALNPNHADAFGVRGDAHLALAGAEEARGKDPGNRYKEAIADYGEALRRNPAVAAHRNGRGTAYLRLGASEKARGQDASVMLQRAIEDSRAALALDPRFWEALANQGLCHELTGDFDKAVECFEASLAIVGDAHPPLKAWLARAKAARDRR